MHIVRRSLDGLYMFAGILAALCLIAILALIVVQMLARWTGDRIRATLHRVIGRNRQRHSVPFFYEPSVDTVIAPLPITGCEPFDPVSYGDHLWEATTRFVEQKGIAHLRQPRAVAGELHRQVDTIASTARQE